MGMRWDAIVGFAEEASWAAMISAPSKLIAVTRGNQVTERIAIEDARATKTKHPHQSVLVGLNETFSWEQWGTPNSIGEILKFTLGDVSSGVITGSEYRHTYSVVEDSPSFTFFIDRGIAISPTKRVAGCKINTLTLECTPRNVLVVSVDGAGKYSDKSASLAVDNDACISFEEEPFTFKDLIFKKVAGDGAVVQDESIERFSMSIAKNLTVDKVTANGSYYIGGLPEGMMAITGSFDKEFSDWDEYDAFVANERWQIEVTYQGASMGVNPYRLYISLPNTRLSAVPLPEVSGSNERMTGSFEFVGLYKCSEAKAISVILDNTTASYGDASSSSSSSSSSSTSTSSSSSSRSSSSSSSSSSTA